MHSEDEQWILFGAKCRVNIEDKPSYCAPFPLPPSPSPSLCVYPKETSYASTQLVTFRMKPIGQVYLCPKHWTFLWTGHFETNYVSILLCYSPRNALVFLLVLYKYGGVWWRVVDVVVVVRVLYSIKRGHAERHPRHSHATWLLCAGTGIAFFGIALRRCAWTLWPLCFEWVIICVFSKF